MDQPPAHPVLPRIAIDPVEHGEPRQLRRRGQVDAQRVLPRIEPFDIGTLQPRSLEQSGIVDQRIDPPAARFERLLPEHLRRGRIGEVGGDLDAALLAGSTARRMADHRDPARRQRLPRRRAYAPARTRNKNDTHAIPYPEICKRCRALAACHKAQHR